MVQLACQAGNSPESGSNSRNLRLSEKMMAVKLSAAAGRMRVLAEEAKIGSW
jgi:hypothetical protein